ncbi:MAG: riboflavin synthase [Burkholderiales bacterium]|jgi:riboflavin synthase|nr:riboflavin synthase [Burkholderiales bacterium]
MFTGIVQSLGSVARFERAGPGARIVIDAGGLDLADVAIGDSIAVNGCCLTVVRHDARTFEMDVSKETLDCTAGLAPNAKVNLEKALRANDRLGGHLVTGHVDGVGTVVSIEPVGDNRKLVFRIPVALAKYVARKGSVTVHGVSLTVNAVSADTFAVNLIPQTLAVTNLGTLTAGDPVNIEIDLIARYVERMLTGDPEGEHS